MNKLTVDEINILIQLMDIATKTGGLQIAQQALPLAFKLQQMAQEEAQKMAEPAAKEELNTELPPVAKAA